MSKNRFVAGLVALFALATLGLADVASACNQQCQVVSGAFCRRCIDTGGYTGQTCQNSGSCGCFYTQNTCGLFASTAAAEAPALELAALSTSVEAPAVFDLEASLAGQ